MKRQLSFLLIGTLAMSSGCLNLQAQNKGDVITYEGKEYLLGPNIIKNGDFSNELVNGKSISGWYGGDGSDASTDNFRWFSEGGAVDGGAYIAAKTGGGNASVGCLTGHWSLTRGNLYYFSCYAKNAVTDNNLQYQVLAQSDNGTNETNLIRNMAFDGGNWFQNEAFFTAEYDYLSFRSRWMITDEANPTSWDNFYLGILIDRADEEQFEIISLQQMLMGYQDAALVLLRSEELKALPGVAAELDNILGESYATEETVDMLNAAIESLSTANENAKNSILVYNNLGSMIQVCEILLNESNFPGYSILDAEKDAALTIYNDVDNSKATDYQNALVKLTQARIDYYLSQIPGTDSPADYSFLVTNPSFRSTPVHAEDAKQTSAGWTPKNTGLPSEGSDMRTGFSNGRTCWNSWSWTFSTMDIHQDLTNLPNGVYSVAAYAITNGSNAYDQHTYATSSYGSAISKTLLESEWTEGWMQLQTGKVVVNDGKLTIGMASTSGGGTVGWFQVTDFSLQYYGAAGIEDLKAMRDAKIVLAEELIQTIELKGDIIALQTAIDAAKATETSDEISASFETLDNAMSKASASVSALKSYKEGIYATIVAAIDPENTELSDEAKFFLTTAITEIDAIIGNDTTTYGAIPVLTADLQAYDKYVVLYDEVIAILENTSDYTVTTVTKLKTTVDEQKTALTSYVDAAQLNTFIYNLNADRMNMLVTKPAGNDTDFSCLIVNPHVNGIAGSAPEGWTCNKGTGNNYTNTNEHYSGVITDRYFDSYNGTKGTLIYSASQELGKIPNGIYKVRVAARTDGNGAFLYCITGEETKLTEIPVYGSSGGLIWENAEEGSPEMEAGSGNGYGWSWVEISNIKITDHKLTLGITCDSTFTEIPFAGNWFSADDFQLLYIEAGDNSDFDWDVKVNVPKISPKNIQVENRCIRVTVDAPYSIYSVYGECVNANVPLAVGIYIVRCGTQSIKVLVK